MFSSDNSNPKPGPIIGSEEIDKLTSTYKNPQKASFPVAYEIFTSDEQRKLASEQSKMSSNPQDGDEKQAEKVKIIEAQEEDKKRYLQLKKYFNTKVKNNNLDNPLIFFDDNAMRIDIGYDSQEFNTHFPDFKNQFESTKTVCVHHADILPPPPPPPSPPSDNSAPIPSTPQSTTSMLNQRLGTDNTISSPNKLVPFNSDESVDKIKTALSRLKDTGWQVNEPNSVEDFRTVANATTNSEFKIHADKLSTKETGKNQQTYEAMLISFQAIHGNSPIKIACTRENEALWQQAINKIYPKQNGRPIIIFSHLEKKADQKQATPNKTSPTTPPTPDKGPPPIRFSM